MVKSNRDFFGPSAWCTLHSFAATYEPSRREDFKMFITSFVRLLPCEKCRKHAIKNLEDFPVEQALDSRDKLFFWTYAFHDFVNKQINADNKKNGRNIPEKISPPFPDVQKMYYDSLTGPGCEECK